MKKASCIVFAFTWLTIQPDIHLAWKSLRALLPGKWVMHTHVATTIEDWTYAGGILQGRTIRIKGKDTVPGEHVVLRMQGQDIFYTPAVPDQNGGKPVPFKMVNDTSLRRFTFINPEHDFPQKIVYEFVNKDSLHAWIEGVYLLEGTPPKNIRRDFYYSKQ